MKFYVIECDVEVNEIGFMIGHEEYIRQTLIFEHDCTLDALSENMSEEEGLKFMDEGMEKFKKLSIEEMVETREHLTIIKSKEIEYESWNGCYLSTHREKTQFRSWGMGYS